MRTQSLSPIPGTSREGADQEDDFQDTDINMETGTGYVGELNELYQILDASVARSRYSYSQIAITMESLFDSFAYIMGSPQTMTYVVRNLLRDATKFCLEAVRILSADHRESHIYISRLGKAIENTFTSPNLSELDKKEFSTPRYKRLINQEILHYILLRGFESVLPWFLEETKPIQDNLQRMKLEEVRIILREIKSTNPFPVFEWIAKQDNEFDYSELLFKLHKVVFRHLALINGDLMAISYAQINFPQFSPIYDEDIGRIMSSLVFTSEGINILFDLSLWNDVKEAFLKSASRALRFTDDNQLLTIVNIGCEVLPKVLEIRERLKNTTHDVTYNIESITSHHSLFTCPILKELCTDDNPPMRLKCGHAISQAALNRLTFNQKLKCPYCPLVQKQSDAKRLYF